MTGIVYKLICPLKKQPIYIGSTINSLKDRLWGHISCSVSGTAAINKYIRENKITPHIEIIEKVSFNERKELRMAESKWIQHYTNDGYSLLNQMNITGECKKGGMNFKDLKSLPPDIVRILLREQGLEKQRLVSTQYSIQATIIKIIRQWENKCREVV